MVSSGYEELEHTADIALRVWGDDYFSLLKESAEGMYDLMGVEIERSIVKRTEFTIEEGNPEMQLVDFLNEVLYFAEGKGSIFETFTFKFDEGKLNVQASGFKAKSIHRNIKAVTFHDLEIQETNLGFETRITFAVPHV